MADLTLNLVKNLPSEIQSGALYLCSSDSSAFIKVGKSGNIIETIYDKHGLIEELHTWISGQGYLTSHQSLSEYSTTSQMNSVISTAVSDMATQTWVRGQGYLTEHQSIKTVNGNTITGTGNVSVGTVTSITTENGIIGGPVTTTGTLALDTRIKGVTNNRRSHWNIPKLSRDSRYR